MSLHLTEEEYAELMRRRGVDTSSVGASADTFPSRGRPLEAAKGETMPTEEEEQIALIEWATRSSGQYPELALLFHIPNGGSRGKGEAGRFKAMGVKKGVPDLFLPVPRGGYHGLFVELKRVAGGEVSKNQREWIDTLTRQGYRAVVCKGWEAARIVIMRYIREV